MSFQTLSCLVSCQLDVADRRRPLDSSCGDLHRPHGQYKARVAMDEGYASERIPGRRRFFDRLEISLDRLLTTAYAARDDWTICCRCIRHRQQRGALHPALLGEAQRIDQRRREIQLLGVAGSKIALDRSGPHKVRRRPPPRRWSQPASSGPYGRPCPLPIRRERMLGTLGVRPVHGANAQNGEVEYWNFVQYKHHGLM